MQLKVKGHGIYIYYHLQGKPNSSGVLTSTSTSSRSLGRAWNSVSQLRDVTCHMTSHSVTFHPTQVNISRLSPSQVSWYSTYIPWRDGRPSWAQVTCYISRWFTRPQTVPGTNPSSYGQRVKLATCRSLVRCPNDY